MRYRVGNTLWGFAFIIAGIGFLGNVLWGWNFDIFFDGWWTLFIIVPCAVSIVQRGPRVGNMIGISIGIVYLLSETYHINYLDELIVPLIFIILGINFITKRDKIHTNKRDKSQTSKNSYYREETTNQTYKKELRNRQRSSVGNRATAIFTSKVFDFSYQIFEGIILNSVLGSITLDLRNADIKDGAYIDIAAVLGGVDIIIPPDVEVKVEQVPILGGVTNKVHTGVLTSIIYLDATCILGGVTIKEH